MARVVQYSCDMNTQINEETRIARMLRELASNLRDAVEAGDMTDAEANEWFNMKAEQWAGGLS